MNLNELPDMSDALKAVQMYEKKKLDPVGKEDGDVDNDGDKDSSDQYLMKRRKAIAKAMKKEHHQKDADGNIIEHDGEEVEEAVYGGTPKKSEDNRMVVTNADKKANTPAYQKFKAGDKRYKAADHMKEEEELDEAMSSYDRNRKRAAQRAAARNAARDAGKTGVVPGVGYVTPRREKETYVDSAGVTRHKSGAKNEAFYFSDEEIADMVEIDEATDQELIDFFVEAIHELAVDEEDLLEICEHLEGVEVITEVSDKYYDSAVKSSKAAAKANRPSRVERMKSAAKKAGSMVKKGVKAVGKKVVSTAGKVAGTYQGSKEAARIKAKRKSMQNTPAKAKDDDGTGGKLDKLLADTRGKSSSGSSSSGGGGERDAGSEARERLKSKSSSSGSTRKAVGGALRAVGSLVKKGLKKAVGKTSRAISKGSDKLAKRLGEDYDRIAHLYESGLFSIEEIENVIEEGYKPIDKKKETAMYRRAGNLSRDALSKGMSTKAGSKAQDKSGKIVSAISSQKERERFSKMADIKARSNYGG
ncbi:gp185 [Synechococcus phage S-SSM5]|uniref:Gp185 n=1 Tax=Synechococcus phage S-SSM5 TaxID=445685 RepID=E3SKL9_9CAUD|nr:cytidyltransferase [Synechococcus phage S-SSM5]ADO97891.1 gp185 [Synechococcus phage S-SSM5]